MRQFRGEVGSWLDRTTNGNPPANAEQWINSMTRDAGTATAGKTGKTGFVGKLFGLDRIPGLSEAQSKRLRRSGLVNVGLTLMGRPNGVSTWQALGQGLLAARADTAESAGELMDLQNAQKEMQRRSEIFAAEDLSPLEKWEEFRRQALVSGNTEAAEIASDNISELRDMEVGEAEAELTEIDGQTFEVRRKDDGSVEIRDPFSGEVVQERPAPPQDESERLNRINQLADDFRTEASGLIEAQRFAENAEGAPSSAAGDQTLVVTLNKLLDPRSTIRQGEFDRVAEIGGFTGQAQQFANQIVSEGELGEQARQSIRDEIERLKRANAQELQSVGQHYRRRAVDAGLDPRLVVRSAFTNGGAGGSPGGTGEGEPDDPFAGPPPGQGGN